MESKEWNVSVGRISVSDGIDRLNVDASPWVRPSPVRVNIHKWEDFFLLASKFQNDHWVFRGESTIGRAITSSIERNRDCSSDVNFSSDECSLTSRSNIDENINGNNLASYGQQVIGKISKTIAEGLRKCAKENRLRDEKSAINLFRQYLKDVKIEGDDYLGWLCFMQHYGVPTRLVDFTRSMFVALYFAFEKRKQTDRVIWAINRAALKRCRTDLETALKCSKLSAHSVGNMCIEKEFADCLGVMPVEFPGNNSRIKAQNGMFLFPYTIDSFEENLSVALGFEFSGEKGFAQSPQMVGDLSIDDVPMIQIVLNNELYDSARMVLKVANIDSSMIYPDIEGVAKEVGRMYCGL